MLFKPNNRFFVFFKSVRKSIPN